MTTDDDEATDEQAEERIVGDPVRVLGRYLGQAAELSAACSALREQLGETPPFSRHEVLHAALEIGLATLRALLPVASHGGGEPVLEVQAIQPGFGNSGVRFNCAPVPDDRRVPTVLQLTNDDGEVIGEVKIKDKDPSPELYTFTAERDSKLDELVPELHLRLPFVLRAPAPTATWLAVAGDLDANRQAPHSTRRSATRRNEHFARLSREREKQRRHMLAAMLAAHANDGQPVFGAVAATTFYVHEAHVRDLLAPTADLPLVLAMTTIRSSEKWRDACQQLNAWRRGPSRDGHLKPVASDDPVALKISRVLHTKCLRYEFIDVAPG